MLLRWPAVKCAKHCHWQRNYGYPKLYCPSPTNIGRQFLSVTWRNRNISLALGSRHSGMTFSIGWVDCCWKWATSLLWWNQRPLLQIASAETEMYSIIITTEGCRLKVVIWLDVCSVKMERAFLQPIKSSTSGIPRYSSGRSWCNHAWNVDCHLPSHHFGDICCC